MAKGKHLVCNTTNHPVTNCESATDFRFSPTECLLQGEVDHIDVDVNKVRFLEYNPAAHIFRNIHPEDFDQKEIQEYLADVKVMAAVLDAVGLNHRFDNPNFRRRLDMYQDIMGTLALPKSDSEPMVVVCNEEEMTRGEFVRRISQIAK